MNWLDIVILVLLAIFVVKGMANGLVRELANLGGTILGIVIAYHRSGALAAWLTEQTGLPLSISQIVAFVGQALLVAALVGLAGAWISQAVRATPARFVDVSGGMILGGVKAFLIVCILLVVFVAIPWDQTFAVLDSSVLADKFLTYVPGIVSVLTKVFDNQLPDGWVPRPITDPV